MNNLSVTTFRLPATRGKTVARLAPSGMPVGTALMTMDGERYIEDLKPGDRVLTKDYGAQAIKCIAFRDVDLMAEPDRSPILIHANAFGSQLPSRPIFLAPDQRVTVRHRMFEMFFGAREVLISARDLIGRNNVSRISNVRAVTYASIAFARHQLLYCGNLAVDLGPCSGVSTRPTLAASDVRIALGVLSGPTQTVPQPALGLH